MMQMISRSTTVADAAEDNRRINKRLRFWQVIHTENLMSRSVRLLSVLVALAATSASGQSLEERYWLALNEGRDLSGMHSVGETLAGPGRQVPPKPEIP